MNPNADHPILYLIGGPNGSGKTTFSGDYLPREAKCRKFLNSDEIAKGLSPFDSAAAQVQAGRILLKNLKQFISAKDSFALESTLSGKTYVKYLEQAKAAGFRIELHFLWLPSAQESHKRVQQRVKEGGHDVPRSDIYRRYPRIMSNLFDEYLPLSDCWYFWNAEKLPLDLFAHSSTTSVEEVQKSLCQKP